jgi:hypothetical protein
VLIILHTLSAMMNQVIKTFNAGLKAVKYIAGNIKS